MLNRPRAALCAHAAASFWRLRSTFAVARRHVIEQARDIGTRRLARLHANPQRARGPGIREFHLRHADLAARVAHRIARQNADAEPGLDHPTYAVEIRRLNPQLERALGGERGVGHARQQRTAVAESHVILVERFREADDVALRERMSLRHQQYEFVAAIQTSLDAGRRHVVREHAQIGLARAQRGDDLVTQTLLERHLDTRMRVQETREIDRQELHDRRRVGPHPHVAAHARRVVAHLARHAVDLIDDAVRMIEQGHARGRELDAARAPDEQRAVGDAFEFRDALAHRGERELPVFRGLGETAVLGHEQKDPQRLQIEMKRIDHRERLKECRCRSDCAALAAAGKVAGGGDATWTWPANAGKHPGQASRKARTRRSGAPAREPEARAIAATSAPPDAAAKTKNHENRENFFSDRKPGDFPIGNARLRSVRRSRSGSDRGHAHTPSGFSASRPCVRPALPRSAIRPYADARSPRRAARRQ
ncbi:hypothetical protein PT2222_220053 [Paraburkholderia tropica]